MPNKKLQIKNKYLPGLVYWLQDLLTGRDSNKIRVEFVNLLQPQITIIENERLSLLKKYAKKDEEGNPVVIISASAKRVYDVPGEEGKKLNEEYGSLLENDFVLEITEKNFEVIKAAKDLICNTDYLFGPKDNDSEDKKKERIQISADYCVWKEIFEGLDF